ncbi:MAG: 16S rRNA processing protein RimM [Bacteroidales bacterium]|nr:16S rRNA processing protein RimM [Bacteroidales bacterium]MBN2818538.1 16S rRNA processing protein RimM [Bacteroidales bacterium]
MINLGDCIKIGFLSKPHGIRGQLNLRLSGTDFEEIKELEQVFVIIDGLPVPFFISEYTVRTNDTIIVLFDDIASEEAAKVLSDSEVYLKKKYLQLPNNEIQQINRLIDFKVIDVNSGFIGKLGAIIEDLQNPLMQVINSRKEYLIPLQEEFIQSIDNNRKEIYVVCPPGLLDIYN